jgi:iron complex outermembrane receptor protein
MTIQTFRLRSQLLAACAASVLAAAAMSGVAYAAEPGAPDAAADAPTGVAEVVVTAERSTRSAVSLPEAQIQKVLPGISPLKAISVLPGVLYVTSDPWGNNEQNLSLFVHGFSTQQLGYTLDNVPLGDQQYGNYNGLSVSRAITSENVGRVTLSSGTGSLGVASTSNLGGAIETFSNDPRAERGFDVRQTVGSYRTTRTFLRFDTGETSLGEGYISYLHQDARAWDFKGHQRGDQVNAKYVHDDEHGKLTVFFDWQDKVEPNEDATAFGNQQTATTQTFTPYTRRFLYPDIAACSSTLTGGPGTPPPAQGNNFSNCFSAAQRTDLLAYVKYDLKLGDNLTWSNQLYYHYNYGRGIVAGPINQAGLPGLFALYYPQLVVGSTTSAQTLQNISNVFGGTGNEVRTTEYRINRGGLLSTVNWNVGNHQIEAGGWFEHNEPGQHRAWYPFSAANNDLSPYDEPVKAAFIQYYFQFYVNDLQLHIQDQWKILPNLTLQAGVKTSLQHANGKLLIAQKGAAAFPSGKLETEEWFLPQFGGVWDVNDTTQVFANAQKNLRQFIPYGAGSNFYGFSPWSLANQAAFDLFKQNVKPETSWTYEAGVRTRMNVDAGALTSIQGQISAYHVNFKNRLLNIAPYNFINPAPAILANVGGVTSNGVDVAATLNFGPSFHLYDALSYNKSKYDSDYSSGTTLVGGVSTPVIVATGGKQVPLVPQWMNRTIASVNFGNFDAQVSADYVGKRFVTYLNDMSVKSNVQFGLQAGYTFDKQMVSFVKSSRISLNVTNLFDKKGISTAVVTGANGGFQGFPIAPRMVFVTLQAGF